jgi:hypothetical protein
VRITRIPDGLVVVVPIAKLLPPFFSPLFLSSATTNQQGKKKASSFSSCFNDRTTLELPLQLVVQVLLVSLTC